MKLVLKILAVVLALIFVAVVSLLLFFDPNMFKPRIEAMAREQGVALNIDGNLGWRLWPNLGVEVNGIRVAAVSAPDDQIAQLSRASLLLAVRPLLRGEVQVHHIIVEGAQISLVVDADGVGNWEALLPEDEPEVAVDEPPAPAEPDVVDDEAADLTLAVERISLRDSALSYRDLGTGQQFSVRDLGFEIRGFNLQGEAFDLTAGWLAEITDPELFGGQTLAVVGNLRGNVQMSTEFDSLQVRDGDLNLNVSRGNHSGRVRALFSAALADLQENLSYQVSLEVPVFNPQPLLAALDVPPMESAEDYALTQVGLKLRAVGDLQQARVEPLELQLDRTRIAGYFALTDMETMAMEILLKGDRINIDDYLPPPTEEEEVAEPEATGDEILIPLEVIQELDIQFALDFEQVTVAAMPLNNIRVRLEAKDGVINLRRADAELYQGKIVSTASLDGRGDTAVIRFDAGVQGLQLAPLMSDMELDDNIGFAGAINALAAGGTQGVTMNQLMAALDAEANFTGAQVRVSPINVERLICQAINTVSRVEQPQRAWDEFTEMRQLAGKVVVKGPEIRLESFDAGVQQLALSMRGLINLDTEAYDFTLPLRLLNTTTSEHGCTVGSNYWIDRSLSLLRCRGTLTELNPLSDCRPDPRGLESLAKDFAEYQLRSRYGDQIDAAQQRLRETERQAREKEAELRRQADEKEAQLRREAEEREEQLRQEAEERRRQEQKAIEDRLRDRLRR